MDFIPRQQGRDNQVNLSLSIHSLNFALDRSLCQAQFSDDMETKEELWEEYKIAIDARNLEINLFWQRSVFYWGFIGAALVAYSELIDNHKTVSFAVALLGCFLSVSWSMLNRGSKWWQESWEATVAEIGQEIATKSGSKIKLFQGGENPKDKTWLGAIRFSPSKVTIGVSDVFCLFWLGIIVKDFYLRFFGNTISVGIENLAYIILPIILLVILILLGIYGKGRN